MLEEKGASLLVLSNCPDHYHHLIAILSHYFPLNEHNQLQLNTKYYSSCITPTLSLWPSLNSLTADTDLSPEELLEKTPEPADKHDLLIMIVGETETFAPLLYDLVVHKYNPDNFILVVNTNKKEQKWADEELIATEVNNFIEIIKEDLQAVSKQPPERTQQGLLTDTYQDGNIFNILELMETTQWSHITRHEPTKPTKEQTQPSTGPADLTNPSQKEADQENNTQKPVQQQQVKETAPEEEGEVSEEQLQQQMNNFEALMHQMMDMKNLSKQQPNQVNQQDRKKKAEDLIGKLMSGSFF